MWLNEFEILVAKAHVDLDRSCPSWCRSIAERVAIGLVERPLDDASGNRRFAAVVDISRQRSFVLRDSHFLCLWPAGSSNGGQNHRTTYHDPLRDCCLSICREFDPKILACPPRFMGSIALATGR